MICGSVFAANAAEEEIAARPNARVTPYWRTLKNGGVLNEKYPGGVVRQKQRLEAEGHKVVRKGKHYLVADLEKSLFEPAPPSPPNEHRRHDDRDIRPTAS